MGRLQGGSISRGTETSPLLANSQEQNSGQSIDSGYTTAPGRADAHQNQATTTHVGQDGGDTEQQLSNSDTSKHQGLPEVRARMKYIFPAIAIGVRARFR